MNRKYAALLAAGIMLGCKPPDKPCELLVSKRAFRYEKTIFVIPEKPGMYPKATEGEMRITNVDKNTEFYTYFRIEDGKKHRYSRKGHYGFYMKNKGEAWLA